MDLNALKDTVNNTLKNFSYVLDESPQIDNVTFVSYVKEKKFFIVRNLCAILEIPDSVQKKEDAQKYFQDAEKKLLNKYGEALLWKELEISLVIICSSDIYKLFKENEGKEFEYIGMKMNSMLGSCFINKYSLDCFSTSTWGLYFSPSHFKALSKAVEEWCMANKNKTV